MNFQDLGGLSNFIRSILGSASFPRRSQAVPVVIHQSAQPIQRADVPPDLPTL